MHACHIMDDGDGPSQPTGSTYVPVGREVTCREVTFLQVCGIHGTEPEIYDPESNVYAKFEATLNLNIVSVSTEFLVRRPLFSRGLTNIAIPT